MTEEESIIVKAFGETERHFLMQALLPLIRMKGEGSEESRQFYWPLIEIMTQSAVAQLRAAMEMGSIELSPDEPAVTNTGILAGVFNSKDGS